MLSIRVLLLSEDDVAGLLVLLLVTCDSPRRDEVLFDEEVAARAFLLDQSLARRLRSTLDFLGSTVDDDDDSGVVE